MHVDVARVQVIEITKLSTVLPVSQEMLDDYEGMDVWRRKFIRSMWSEEERKRDRDAHRAIMGLWRCAQLAWRADRAGVALEVLRAA